MKYTAGKKLIILCLWHLFSEALYVNKILYGTLECLVHFLNPENQISAYTDDVRTAWQIRVL